MTRSKWKGPFLDLSVKKKRDLILYSTNKKYLSLKIWSRRSIIVPPFIEQQVFVHNGRTFQRLKITPEMIGHPFGKFVLTRKNPVHPKEKKKNK